MFSIRKYSLISIITLFLLSCKNKSKQDNNNVPAPNDSNSAILISNKGLGDLKVGMRQPEVEKILGMQFTFKKLNDEYWMDTVNAKYKDLNISLYFQRIYIDEKTSAIELSGLSTSSPACQTTTGIKMGDVKELILEKYNENMLYIYMGPQYEQVNDTSWLPSKTNYNISIRDSTERELIFHLKNKKVASMEVGYVMGD